MMSGVCGPLGSGPRRTRSPRHASRTIQPSGRTQGQHSHVEKFAAIAFGKERSSQVPASSSTKGRAVQ
ncbi:hypothetical protein R6Z07M_015454 [Ovis aries]